MMRSSVIASVALKLGMLEDSHLSAIATVAGVAVNVRVLQINKHLPQALGLLQINRRLSHTLGANAVASVMKAGKQMAMLAMWSRVKRMPTSRCTS
jgi:hypothetical protein